MALVSSTYGKGRVRIMRVHRGEHCHEVRELNVQAMLIGDFSRAYTHADNATTISTDTIKNLVNIVARDNLELDTEAFCSAVCQRFFDRYSQVAGVTVTAHETKWTRLLVDGTPHPHGFTLDSNGKPFAIVTATRDAVSTVSGLAGFTFLKSTESGWENYLKDSYTTIPETHDRLCATSMDSSWTWTAEPADYRDSNATVLRTMLDVFMTTYSCSVQDSVYRMAEAVLAAVPEIGEMRLACPNKHYLPINLTPFGMSSDNTVFVPTDEPHGQIECVIARG